MSRRGNAVTIVEFIDARLNEREALAWAAADDSAAAADDWADVSIETFLLAQAQDAGWTLADVAAKRAMLQPHLIQHRCVNATVEGGYELADEQPFLVLRQLAATESAHRDYGSWQ